MELKGKVAFITGAATGIGKGIAEALLQNEVKVFLTDIDESKGLSTLGEFETKFGSQNVRFGKLDVTNEDQFEEVFKAAITAFGQVDIMINNAGIADESNWQLVIKVNLFGTVKGSKLAHEHMRKDKGGKGGRIINVCSIAGLHYNLCHVPVYCGTKHAVKAFTMSQASQFDLAAQGIEYAIVCPGAVDTNLVKMTSEKTMLYYEQLKEKVHDTMPVTRVADAVLELLHLETMNGAMLQVLKDGRSYQKNELVDLGQTYASCLPKE